MKSAPLLVNLDSSQALMNESQDATTISVHTSVSTSLSPQTDISDLV